MRILKYLLSLFKDTTDSFKKLHQHDYKDLLYSYSWWEIAGETIKRWVAPADTEITAKVIADMDSAVWYKERSVFRGYGLTYSFARGALYGDGWRKDLSVGETIRILLEIEHRGIHLVSAEEAFNKNEKLSV